MGELGVLAEKIYPIGVQRLLREDNDYFLEIKNRSYYSKIPIPFEKVSVWIKELS